MKPLIFDPLRSHIAAEPNPEWSGHYSLAQTLLAHGISSVHYSQDKVTGLRQKFFLYAAQRLRSIIVDYPVEVSSMQCLHPFVPASIDVRLLPQQRVVLYLLAVAKNQGVERALKCLDLLWQECWLVEGRDFYDTLWKVLANVGSGGPQGVGNLRLPCSVLRDVDHKATGVEPTDVRTYVEAKLAHIRSLFVNKRLSIDEQQALLGRTQQSVDAMPADPANIIPMVITKCEADWRAGIEIQKNVKSVLEWLIALFRIGAICGTSYAHAFIHDKTTGQPEQLEELEHWNRASEEHAADSVATLSVGPLAEILNVFGDMQQSHRKGGLVEAATQVAFQAKRLRAPVFILEKLLPYCGELKPSTEVMRILAEAHLSMGAGYIMCYQEEAGLRDLP